MRRYALLFLAALCTSTLTSAEPAPLPNPKVGDWVEMKFAGTLPGASETTSRQRLTVTAVSTTDYTVQITTLNAKPGEDTFVSTCTPLNQPFGIWNEIKDQKPTAEGEEEITIGAQKLRCKWASYQIKHPTTTSITHTVYFYPDIPLIGLARVDTTSETGYKAKELVTAFGRAKDSSETKQP